MATFSSLFDFPDLSDGQSELSSPPDSSDDKHSDEHSEDEDDAWYNLPSDSEDEDDDSSTLALALPIRLALALLSVTTVVVSTIVCKEHSTGARIKAIYMLEEKKPLA